MEYEIELLPLVFKHIKVKTCKRCNIEKDDSFFGLATSKYKDKVYTFLKPNCKKCDAELSNIYYNRKKNDESFKKKNRDRAKKYVNKNYEKIKARKNTKEFKEKHSALNMKSYIRMKDVISAKMKEKRQTTEYKEKMREYRKNNKDKIYQQEVITKRRYHEKNKKDISDKYVYHLLKSQGKIKTDMVCTSNEVLEQHKAKVLISRIKDFIRITSLGLSKVCARCQKDKDIVEFWTNRSSKDGKSIYCIECQKIKKSEYKKKKK